MDILVIGAAGMIGRKLVSALVAKGDSAGRTDGKFFDEIIRVHIEDDLDDALPA